MSTNALALFCKVVQIGLSFSENMRSKIIETCNPEHRVLEAHCPVLKINNHATGGWRTKDILGGPKSLETKKLDSSKG